MAPKNIRDLFSGTPSPTPTLREIAADYDYERVDTTQENREFTARMPGDQVSDHPLMQSQKGNPFYGLSPLKVSRLLRAGKLSLDQERQARAWLDQYQKLTGEVLYDSRNHEQEEPEPNPKVGITRADPYPDYPPPPPRPGLGR